MPFYWSTHSLPELANIPKSDRGRVWRDAMKRAGWSWRLVLAFLTPIPLALVLVFNYKELAAFLGIGRLGGIAVLLVGLTTSNMLGVQVQIWAVRPYLRELIGGLCLSCGYDLRASPERCPECGTIPKSD